MTIAPTIASIGPMAAQTQIPGIGKTTPTKPMQLDLGEKDQVRAAGPRCARTAKKTRARVCSITRQSTVDAYPRHLAAAMISTSTSTSGLISSVTTCNMNARLTSPNISTRTLA